MTLVKTSVIACALSALLAGPVLAQGPSADTKGRNGAQSIQGGMSEDEDLAPEPHATGGKMGVKSTKSTKDTKGAAGTATHKGTVGDSATSGAPVSGKRQ
ncbi:MULTISPECIES: hypothetical protein [unclassified Bradyrhizobium]|uniref:hypothetical protein n=1 Tax=unclassified Bradyrhizobium TaxID=2631580 RepID=UPI002479DF40|nr:MULTISPECIES: hypothetical protein [unclassified Bradyrhizobium]WGR93245.1 hypothetical protein MTX20_36720 [Bradyrhizobium sp. ISRA435]WGR97770.1 hypothetical protein MTX23_25755 [Bradyrhizobium sp. ISRA436]WGS04659.1 hypothetical protein MTX18_25760 [Bradyrhizobium sp. ISRA437]WGS11540.1 hypothetical protein MTX26_25760 [Bradyrhizobium sp. ISRA443]WGS19026.1 hypothetical protein MTX22_31695 [Bradyrhizobium sp. ISRA463]